MSKWVPSIPVSLKFLIPSSLYDQYYHNLFHDLATSTPPVPESSSLVSSASPSSLISLASNLAFYRSLRIHYHGTEAKADTVSSSVPSKGSVSVPLTSTTYSSTVDLSIVSPSSFLFTLTDETQNTVVGFIPVDPDASTNRRGGSPKRGSINRRNSASSASMGTSNTNLPEEFSLLYQQPYYNSTTTDKQYIYTVRKALLSRDATIGPIIHITKHTGNNITGDLPLSSSVVGTSASPSTSPAYVSVVITFLFNISSVILMDNIADYDHPSVDTVMRTVLYKGLQWYDSYQPTVNRSFLSRHTLASIPHPEEFSLSSEPACVANAHGTSVSRLSSSPSEPPVPTHFTSVTSVMNSLVPDYVNISALHPRIQSLHLVSGTGCTKDSKNGTAVKANNVPSILSGRKSSSETLNTTTLALSTTTTDNDASTHTVRKIRNYQKQAIHWMYQRELRLGLPSYGANVPFVHSSMNDTSSFTDVTVVLGEVSTLIHKQATFIAHIVNHLKHGSTNGSHYGNPSDGRDDKDPIPSPGQTSSKRTQQSFQNVATHPLWQIYPALFLVNTEVQEIRHNSTEKKHPKAHPHSPLHRPLLEDPLRLPCCSYYFNPITGYIIKQECNECVLDIPLDQRNSTDNTIEGPPRRDTATVNPFSATSTPSTLAYDGVPAGGLLCDEPGLGKTLECIGLIMVNHLCPPTYAAPSSTSEDDGTTLLRRSIFPHLPRPSTSLSSSSSHKDIYIPPSRPYWQELDQGLHLLRHVSHEYFQLLPSIVRPSTTTLPPSSSFPSTLPRSVPSVPYVSRATLIIVPSNILIQWREEVQAWAPQLSIIIYDGAQKMVEHLALQQSTPSNRAQWFVREQKNSYHSNGQEIQQEEIRKVTVETLAQLVSADIVLATFDTLASDIDHTKQREQQALRFSKRYPVVPSPLLDCYFHRIIIDEAQYIERSNRTTTGSDDTTDEGSTEADEENETSSSPKKSRTNASLTVSSPLTMIANTPLPKRTEMILRLQGMYTWCVSGTPLAAAEDVRAILKFLRHRPFGFDTWWRTIFAKALRKTHTRNDEDDEMDGNYNEEDNRNNNGTEYDQETPRTNEKKRRRTSDAVQRTSESSWESKDHHDKDSTNDSFEITNNISQLSVPNDSLLSLSTRTTSEMIAQGEAYLRSSLGEGYDLLYAILNTIVWRNTHAKVREDGELMLPPIHNLVIMVQPGAYEESIYRELRQKHDETLHQLRYMINEMSRTLLPFDPDSLGTTVNSSIFSLTKSSVFKSLSVPKQIKYLQSSYRTALETAITDLRQACVHVPSANHATARLGIQVPTSHTGSSLTDTFSRLILRAELEADEAKRSLYRTMVLLGSLAEICATTYYKYYHQQTEAPRLTKESTSSSSTTATLFPSATALRQAYKSWTKEALEWYERGWKLSEDHVISREEYTQEVAALRAWKTLDMAALSGRARLAEYLEDPMIAVVAHEAISQSVLEPFIAAKLRIQLFFCIENIREPLRRLRTPVNQWFQNIDYLHPDLVRIIKECYDRTEGMMFPMKQREGKAFTMVTNGRANNPPKQDSNPIGSLVGCAAALGETDEFDEDYQSQAELQWLRQKYAQSNAILTSGRSQASFYFPKGAHSNAGTTTLTTSAEPVYALPTRLLRLRPEDGNDGVLSSDFMHKVEELKPFLQTVKKLLSDLYFFKQCDERAYAGERILDNLSSTQKYDIRIRQLRHECLEELKNNGTIVATSNTVRPSNAFSSSSALSSLSVRSNSSTSLTMIEQFLKREIGIRPVPNDPVAYPFGTDERPRQLRDYANQYYHYVTASKHQHLLKDPSFWLNNQVHHRYDLPQVRGILWNWTTVALESLVPDIEDSINYLDNILEIKRMAIELQEREKEVLETWEEMLNSQVRLRLPFETDDWSRLQPAEAENTEKSTDASGYVSAFSTGVLPSQGLHPRIQSIREEFDALYKRDETVAKKLQNRVRYQHAVNALIRKHAESMKDERNTASVEPNYVVDEDAEPVSFRCPICVNEPPIRDTVLLPCGHVVCAVCLEKWRTVSRSSICATCREPFTNDQLFTVDPDTMGREIRITTVSDYLLHGAVPYTVTGNDGTEGISTLTTTTTATPTSPSAHTKAKKGRTSKVSSSTVVPLASSSSLAPLSFPTIDIPSVSTVNGIELAGGYTQYGTKIATVCRRLRTLPSDDKAIIVCSWPKVLDLMHRALKHEHIQSVILLGSATQRAQVVARFRQSSSVKALLLHSTADSSGLTLTMANHIFLLDAVPSSVHVTQVIGRIARQGQTKPCLIYHYLTHNSVEEKVFRIREGPNHHPTSGSGIKEGVANAPTENMEGLSSVEFMTNVLDHG